MSEKMPFHIVGIGASAGGLEALEEFFSSASIGDPMAFIVIQHLSPDFKSLMSQLLARRTALPISVIEDDMLVQSGHIYLLPPNKEAIIASGKLFLADRSKAETVSFPIDHFFRSLAQDQEHRSVGVVLSGTGTDGSRGVLDIHGCGGLVITQRDAKFDGMPNSVKLSGVADFELHAEKMIPSILRHIHGGDAARSEYTRDISLAQLQEPTLRILSELNLAYGLDFTNYRTATISRRVDRRLSLVGLDSIEDYADRIANDRKELEMLYHDLLIGVTQFFRDIDVFQKLSSTIVPTIIERGSGDQEIRVWVAACGTGQEAYSIAITLMEQLERLGVHREVRVFASDVHQKSLAFASRGIYESSQLTGLSEDRVRRFFMRRGDSFQVSPELRKLCVFSPHNVVRDAPFTRLDFITCRNLLIYLTRAAQRKVLSLFHFGLKRDGFLCLGNSESIGDLDDEYRVVDEPTRIFSKNRELKYNVDGAKSLVGQPPKVTPDASLPMLTALAGTPRGLLKTYDTLLEQFMPPAVLIDSSRQILHTFPGANRFMQVSSGRPSNDLLSLIHPSLRPVISSALRQLSTTENAVAANGIPFVVDGPVTSGAEDQPESVLLNITLLQFKSNDNNQHILVLFDTGKPDAELVVEPIEIAPTSVTREIESLERELEFTKDNLQSTIEELQTTNEELQSTNEQLTASNEELQSTNEELHSVNEELYTVNSEHQRKIGELMELTTDMDNLLNSIDVHSLFLDRDLGIRRFTAGIAKIFNLIPQDVGRQFDTFTRKINHDSLDQDIQHVLATGESIETEVADDRGTWFFLRIRPYVASNGIAGVILTLVDVTSLKVAQAKLYELSAIVEHSEDAIYRVDLHGKIRTWNRGAVRLFGFETEEALGQSDSILATDDRITEASHYLDRICRGQSVERLETMRRRKNGDRFDVSITVSPICNHSGEIEGASIIARDITQQKKAESEIRAAVSHRDEFLGTLSHELRNPFAAILNAASLLKTDGLDQDSEVEAREVIESQLRHVSHLLDDLLEVSRFTNGKLVLQNEVFDLTKLSGEVFDCVQHRIDQAEQVLRTHCVDQPVFISGDRGRLQQAQVNLLVNASKYSPEHSTISYSISLDSDSAVITVRDEGEGIPSSLLPTIFDPFVQADQSIDRSQGGMGLGLPLVKAIASAHDGNVEAHSAGPGCGSEFVIRIPTTDQRPQPKLDESDHELDDLSVLLVEDNDGIRRMLARMLQLRGFKVQTAASGQQGLVKLRREPPQIALVDIGLPDLDGYQFAKAVRNDSKYDETILIAVTGYGREDDVRRATKVGFDLHLIKPVEPDDLVKQISRIRNRKRQSLMKAK